VTLVQSLLILVATAHLFGWLAERVKQPALLGHILAGAIWGPVALGRLGPDPALRALSDLAVLFVVLSAGLEMQLRQLRDVFRGAGTLALMPGFLLPALAGFAFARLSGEALRASVVVGLCTSVTALPVALRILERAGLLQTSIARIAISGALLSDVVVLLAIGALTPGADPVARSPLWLTAAAALKLGGLLAMTAGGSSACRWLLRRAGPAGADRARPQSAQLLVALLFILAVAAGSEWLGLHFAIGGFLASLMVSDGLSGTEPGRQLKQASGFMTDALFGPLFLAYQGLQLVPGGFAGSGFVAGLVGIAIVSKMAGGYLTGALSGLSRHVSWGVAVVMNARGVMEMVIASIAFRAGLIGPALFSTLLVMGMVTTVLTPILLGRWQRRVG